MNEPAARLEPALQQLLQRPDLWQGRAGGPVEEGEATGFARLDRSLPTGGWPRGALTELLPERAGIGELRLLMPALARLSRGARWVAWIDPPHVPHAAALHACSLDLTHTLVVHPRNARERLWALEQALGSGTCAAVLGWPGALDAKSSRRLQLAAEAGDTLGFLFRDPAAGRAISHAALRLSLSPCRGGLALKPLKHRGAWPGEALTLTASELFAPGRPEGLPSGTG